MKQKKTKLKTLDLHGYKSDEVDAAVDHFLVQNQKAQRLRIMTGKGKGIVKQLVLTYLQRAGYPWQYEELPNGKQNDGCLIVFMD